MQRGVLKSTGLIPWASNPISLARIFMLHRAAESATRVATLCNALDMREVTRQKRAADQWHTAPTLAMPLECLCLTADLAV